LSVSTVSPKVLFSEDYPGYKAPRIKISTDLGPEIFGHEAGISIPKLLYLLEHLGGTAAFTHIAIGVISGFFGEHHDWEYEVSLELDGQPFDKRLYHKWYRNHQFLIPLTAFRKKSQAISLFSKLTREGAPTSDEINFEISISLISKPRIWENFERNAIWVFSTARSGSTWLCMDVLCAEGRARPVDESGIGRMFAPMQWDAERFFDPAERPFHIESGLSFETGLEERPTGDALPVFERAFFGMENENAILSRHNFDFFHRALRDIVFEHVLNEWGIFGFSRLVFKMPNDSHAADFIVRAFPNSRIVFLMRDGRDIMKSRFSPFASPTLAKTSNVELRRYAIAFYSHFWNFQVDIMRAAFEAHAPERRVFINYEDLRRDPGQMIAELFDRLQISASPDEIAALAESSRLENMPASERGPDKPRQTGLIGGYRAVFSDEEIALMDAIMGQNLERYGYEIG
jgi:hypothetical protein